MWVTLLFQIRSQALHSQGSELILGYSISVDSGSNWVHGRQLIKVSQLCALEQKHRDKLNLIT